VLSSLFVWFILPDFPERAKWLSESEKDLAAQRLLVEGSKGSAAGLTWADVKATLTDWRLYGHYAIYFAVSLPFSSLSLFTPSIVTGLGYKDLQAQLLTVPPWAIAYGTIPTLTNVDLELTRDSRVNPQLLVCRPFQCSWSTLRRSCSGGSGGLPRVCCPAPNRVCEPVRHAHRGHVGRLWMHPADARLAHLQHLEHRIGRIGRRPQRQYRCRTGTDPGRVDLQSR